MELSNMTKSGSQNQIVLLTLAVLCIVGMIAGVSAQTGGNSNDIPGSALGDIRPITTESAMSAISGETLISTLPSTYDTYTYTHSDLLIFSYTNGTQFEVYNSASSLVWSGTVNAGGHKGLSSSDGVYAGTYKIKGTNQYSVLTGDELTSYVMGYYAFDKDGKGLSTKIYTYQVNTNSWTSTDYRNFIVFAYEDSTSVVITNTETGAAIWSGVLNTGQHHAEPTLSNVYITVTATKPVSALSYTDQGYYIPASSGTFMGNKFYSWVGRAGGWTEDLNIIAYSDSTTATVTNTETGAPIWNGTLNAGSVQSIPLTSAQYVTITTNKDVNAGIFPYISTSSYYYSVHAQDTSGTGIGTLFYFPAIPSGKMVIFAFTNNTLVTVTNSAGGAVWSGYLNNGESHQLTPATKDVYKIVGSNLMSVVYDWGDNCGADFAPQYYATPTTPTVTLNQPNGGETWTVGTNQNITWVASGGTGSLSASLYYSSTGITGTYTQIASGLQNTGSYTWTVPNTPSTTAAVKITVTDSAGNVASDTSNAVFTIKSATTNQLTLTINQIDNSSFGTITTFVTVTNQAGTSITGLTASNFAVSEGSSCTPTITVTPVSSTGKPVSIPMCVDYSGSMSAADIASAKTGLKNFINMSATNDRFAILKFATTVEVVQALTSDKTLLLSKVNSMSDYSGGNTALYDSIYDGVTLAKSESYRKAVIAFTDGNSNSDVHSMTETIAYAKANGVPVYTIGLGSVNPSVLQQIANQTGGQYYYAPTSDQLSNIYSQISQSLSNQYQITYQTCNPTRDGTYRDVMVTATYSGLTGTDTRGYYAPSQTVSSVTITGLTPTSGPVGTTVSITGSGFVSGSTVKIGTVNATSTVISSTTITAIVPTLSAGTYDVRVTNPDGGFGLLANAFTVTGTSGNSTLRGFVFDSVTNLKVPGATISIAGLTNTSDSNGNYIITGIPPGALDADFTGSPRSGLAPLTVSFSDLSVTNANILTVTKTGYYTFTNNGISIEPGQTLQYDVPITPELAPGGGEYRIVLTWGENPRDLDSHLVTPMIEGHTYHVYYASKGSMTSPPYAILDLDDQYSYGPETVTINRTFSGTYNYYVHHWTGTGSLSTSNAQVIVYSGSALVATYRVPNTGNGRYWQVFNLAGATGAITSINTIADVPQNSSSSASSPDLATYPKKPADTTNRQFINPQGIGFSEDQFAVKNLAVDPILTWSWNFGDGSTATTQNPTHTYSNTGSYPVTLTVTNSMGTNTETKTNYITVTSTQPVASKVGIFRSGNFFLASSNSNGGGTVNAFNFGQSGDLALVGDWSGSGTTKVGIFRNGAFYLASSNTNGGGTVNAFGYGQAGDKPVVGDWNGDGIDTVGIFRNGAFYLASSNTNGGGTVNAFGYGQAGDVPVAGDWDGDSIDTVGIFRNGAFYLASSNTPGGGTVNAFGYGQAGDMPVVGDWNEDGKTEVGIYRTDPYRGAFYLASSNTPGGGTVNAFTYGMLGDVPVAGKWT